MTSLSVRLLCRCHRHDGPYSWPIRRPCGYQPTLGVSSSTSSIAPNIVQRIPFSLLESGQTDKTTVRPWFWILCLFLVPILGSMGYHYYVARMNRTVVGIESILTQLVFNYGLRLRAVNEGSEKDQDEDKKKKNFLGKLNTMVTSDLESINQAKVIIMLCECRRFLQGSYPLC